MLNVFLHPYVWSICQNFCKISKKNVFQQDFSEKTNNFGKIEKYFLGDNVNVIEIQIWVTMIAYLLLRVMQVKSMSKLTFSNIVMLTRVTLGAYIDIITLLNCPILDWNLLEQQRARWLASQKYRQLDLFDTQMGVTF